VEEEAPTGRELVIRRELLLALGRSSGAEPITAAEAERLVQLDVLGPDGRPVQFAAPTADAVGAPLATLQLVAARPGGLRAADLWVGATRAVLHARTAGEAPVVSVGRSLFPQLLVRAIGLGPRPRSDLSAFAASAARVADACRGAAAPPWPGEEPVPRPQLWRLSWEAAAGATGDLAVLDLGDRGLWRPAEGEGDALAWSPVDSGSVWCRLAELFAVTLEDRLAG
jgi:hypothetical protein